MSVSAFLQTLDKKRRTLGMSLEVLAKRSNVSLATVVRILSGKGSSASFESVWAIANALGVQLRLDSKGTRNVLREQVKKKATEAVKLVQGTNLLEGQGINQASLRELRRKAIAALLAGPRRNLWRN